LDDVLHDLRLARVARNSIEHQVIDIGLEGVRADMIANPHFPKLNRQVVRHELAAGRVIDELLPERCTGIQSPENIAARAMKEPRNRPQDLSLSALAAARSAENEDRAIFH